MFLGIWPIVLWESIIAVNEMAFNAEFQFLNQVFYILAIFLVSIILSFLLVHVPLNFRDINHNLEYGDTKSGQLRYWLVKKNIFYMHAIKTFL